MSGVDETTEAQPTEENTNAGSGEQAEEAPPEPEGLSRMGTADELVALAEEEKVDEVAPDIVTEAAALAQEEATAEGGEPAQPPPERAERSDAPATEEVQEGDTAAAAASTEEGEQAEAPEQEAQPNDETEKGEVSESTEQAGEPGAEGEATERVEESEGAERAEGAEGVEGGGAPETTEQVEKGEQPVAEDEEETTVEVDDQPPSETTDETKDETAAGESHVKVDRKVSRTRFEPLRSAIAEEKADGDEELEEKDEDRLEEDAFGRQSDYQDELEVDSEEDIEEEALPKFTRQQLIESIQVQIQEREALKLKNQSVQHKLALYFQNKRADDRIAFDAAGEGEQKYASLLSKYTELLREKRVLDEHSREQLDGLRERREQLRQDGESLLTQLRELKRTTLLGSVSSKSGKTPQWDDLEPLFSTEEKKDGDIHKMLIENIILRNRIHKIEDTMKAKDKLGEGLHMIDFEQLKIENQTYNEKIEERNEDISKLRKKITTSVEVLTHVKEKLEHLRHENAFQKQKLEEVDKTLGVKRSRVTRLKQSRDMLKTDNERLKQSAGLLGKNDLLRDFENKVDEAELLRRRLADLQVTHAEVTMAGTSLNKKINGLKASNPTLQANMTEPNKAFHRK